MKFAWHVERKNNNREELLQKCPKLTMEREREIEKEKEKKR